LKANETIRQILESYPIIAAIRDESGLNQALASPAQVIFILHSSLSDIKDQVERVKAGDKAVFIHQEMVDGLSKDQAALRFLQQEVAPTGIITTKPNLLQPAKDLGLCTVQRLFILDSQSIQTGLKMMQSNHTDFIEVMPGIIPKIIPELRKHSRIPIIAGGMIRSKDEIIEMLKAGVTAVSTSSAALWDL
jgi:Glycerol-3-phosphate responsive antiterminator (mRNA-binding)